MISIKSESHLKVLREYASKFNYCIVIDKSRANWREKKSKDEIINWCRQSCGREYKDWFCHSGSMKDETVSFFFIDEKRATWFSLMWSNYIDTQQQIRDT